MRLLFPLILLLGSASAQLRVTAPATPPCVAGAESILGIALEPVFSGTYGARSAQALKNALELAGYRVVPDYDFKIADHASILITGEVEQWRSSNGNYAERVGTVRLLVSDVNTEERLLNIDQDRAFIVLNAPRLEDFTKSVTEIIKTRYCQLPRGT